MPAYQNINTLCRGVLHVGTYKEAAGQSWKRGQALTLDGNGDLSIAVASTSTYGSASIAATASGLIALQDATGVTGAVTTVIKPIEGIEYLMPVINAAMTATTDRTLIGETFDVAHYTYNGVTGIGCQIDKTTNANFIVTGLHEEFGKPGELLGWVWGRWIEAKRII